MQTMHADVNEIEETGDKFDGSSSSSVADMQTKHADKTVFDGKDLLKIAMAGEWDTVVDIFKKYPLARRGKVTRAENTVLHLAVLKEDDNLVEQLVNAIEKEEAHHILSLPNNLGNTPLHVAAALGLPRICWLLAEKCKELVVDARNHAKETPLYIAARRGNKRTFFVLQDFVRKLKDIVPETLESTWYHDLGFCQRGDGNTILHAAVRGEYFGLAIEIIKLYPSLVNFYNDIRQTPLHLLANMPLAFKSGSRLRGIDKLIYSCIIVDELKTEYKRGQFNGWKKEKEINMPEDHATDMNLPQLPHHTSCPTDKGQSLKDNNNDGLDALTSNKDLERGEEYGNHVRSTKPKIGERLITGSNFLMIVMKLLHFPAGNQTINAIQREKIKHEHASQVMKALVQHASYWEYGEDGKLSNEEQKQDEIAITPIKPPDEESSASKSSIGKIMQTKNLKKDGDKKADEPIQEKQDTPILIAAKQGVVEMVKSILDSFPEVVQDFNSNHKNIVLLSIEHRQMQVFKHLLERKPMRKSIFGMVDKDGNTALHLVARLATTNHPWLNSANKAIQLQREYKLYKFVENSMEPGFFQQYNNKGETAMEIFSKSHESLVKEGREWLTEISKSCSVVAILVVGATYTSVTTIPGSLYETDGYANFVTYDSSEQFTLSALVALLTATLSLLIFLSVLTSSFQEKEFRRKLPLKFRLGIDFLFLSVATMLLSIFTGFALTAYRYMTYVAPAVILGVIIYFIFMELYFYYKLFSSTVGV